MVKMSDEIEEVPGELIERLIREVRPAFELHQGEVRRSTQIADSFFEKLAALSAGTLGIAVSILFLIIGKPEWLSGQMRQVAHWTVVILMSLLVSLVLSIIHNVITAGIANLEADYSESELTRAFIRVSLSMVTELTLGISEDQVQLVEARIGDKPLASQQRNAKRRRTLDLVAKILGLIAIGAFIAAYTLIMVGGLFRIWWITR
jgi:hypothetical protein